MRRGRRRQPRKVRMFRFQGLIDFSRLPPDWVQEPKTRREASFEQLNLPGLDLRWNPTHVSVALSNGILAVVAGRARAGSSPPTRGGDSEAARWIERYQ